MQARLQRGREDQLTSKAEGEASQNIDLGMRQRGAEDLSARAIAVSNPVAGRVDHSSSRIRDTRSDRDVATAECLPRLGESHPPSLVQSPPEGLGGL